jgi:glucose/arabinose dehydrogenase
MGRYRQGWTKRWSLLGAALGAAALWTTGGHAQQDVPFAGGVPVAPTGLADNPLPAGPFRYRTAEGMDIRVEVVARDIEYPMALAFLPSRDMLIVTRKGELHLLEEGASRTRVIEGGPIGVFAGESGAVGTSHAYVDIALHPEFATNGYVYIAYNKPEGEGRVLALGRGRWTGERIDGFEDIWVAPSGVSGVMRLAFAHDGTLFFTTSGADAQNLGTAGGKVLRINADGSIPADNPFATSRTARKDVYSYGHRGALGLAIHPRTGAVWESENGNNGGDEINVIKPGVNYGWPFVSLGRTYTGPWQAGRAGPGHEIFEPPVVYWMPAIAVSGLMFYTGDALPKWKGDIFVGALRTGEIPGTGHLERILVNENMEELRRETLLYDLRQRVRDVKQGPEGYIYMAVEQKDGSILRIVPDN